MSAVSSVVRSVFGGGAKPPAPPAASAAELAPADKEVQARERAAGAQRAAGAGVSESENDAGLLGLSGAPRKRAARSILG